MKTILIQSACVQLIRWNVMLKLEKFTEGTNPKVPATSLHSICAEDIDAHIASPKSDN